MSAQALEVLEASERASALKLVRLSSEQVAKSPQEARVEQQQANDGIFISLVSGSVAMSSVAKSEA